MHRLPILLIKKEVIESRVFIRGGYVNSALCVEGARIISVLQKNPACVIPLSLWTWNSAFLLISLTISAMGIRQA